MTHSDKKKRKPWTPAIYQCSACEHLLWSAWSGYFASCKCGRSFIDQTYHYGRLGGEIRPYGDPDGPTLAQQLEMYRIQMYAVITLESGAEGWSGRITTRAGDGMDATRLWEESSLDRLLVKMLQHVPADD